MDNINCSYNDLIYTKNVIYYFFLTSAFSGLIFYENGQLLVFEMSSAILERW